MYTVRCVNCNAPLFQIEDRESVTALHTCMRGSVGDLRPCVQHLNQRLEALELEKKND